MYMTDILKEIRKLIENGWCRVNFAENEHGKAVYPDDPTAVKFSLGGAIIKVSQGNEIIDYGLEAIFMYYFVPGCNESLEDFNEYNSYLDRERTQEEVLDVIDAAIRYYE